jgi:hypothetical protein
MRKLAYVGLMLGALQGLVAERGYAQEEPPVSGDPDPGPGDPGPGPGDPNGNCPVDGDDCGPGTRPGNDDPNNPSGDNLRGCCEWDWVGGVKKCTLHSHGRACP